MNGGTPSDSTDGDQQASGPLGLRRQSDEPGDGHRRGRLHWIPSRREPGCPRSHDRRRRLPVQGSDALPDENLAPVRDDPQCVLVSADLAQDGLDDAVVGCDIVFHLATRPGVRQSWRDEFDDYTRPNVVGTRRRLNACVRRGVRRLVLQRPRSPSRDRAGSRTLPVRQPLQTYCGQGWPSTQP
ncbi:NAD-dependent epimerase/dehydratase family protein [Pseudofrankia saprophytica]|uniref:NAD-dependent epimerase/dehydratase family protein n=1 Tax=Pseudofrankia saprophytica TaxID=298655 RepID=UPI003CC912CA